MIEGPTERGKVILHAKDLGINPRTAMCWWKHYQETGKVVKQNTGTSRKSPKPNTEKKVDSNQTEHIEGLGQANLKSAEGKCVLIDPGRRDLMYCMKETSTVEEKQTLIFTKNNRSKCSRHFRYLRKRTQPFVVQKAEVILFRSESNSVNLKNFVQ
jgi:hypothetical protein